MQPGIRKLIDDAKAKGLRVIESNDYALVSKGKTNRAVGLEIWPDGTATRADVALSVTTTIRTQKQMREILGL